MPTDRNVFGISSPPVHSQEVIRCCNGAIVRPRSNAVAQAAAISKSQAVIEFEMDGTIITANQNFLDALGYRLEEIQGKHHSDVRRRRSCADSAEYRKFWADLNRGEFQAAEYKRVGKGGREVWIQASYNPILDRSRQAVQGHQVRHRHHREERSAAWKMPARSRPSAARRR